MNIKPSDKTIKELLGSKNQFCIPRFQREYSWTKKNYLEFLKDMAKGLEISDGKINPTQYFLGTMLFIGDYEDKKDKAIEVVDGQQRLTTITILFSVLSDIFKSLNEEKLSDKIFEYIMNEDDNGDPVRVLRTKTSYPFFIQEKNKDCSNDPESEEEEAIKSCYECFYSELKEKNIKEILAERYNESIVEKVPYVEILKALRDQVLQTTFISISTYDRTQANIIFEILNAKGKQLTYIDLIKNKIFEILDDEEPADFATEKWQSIKKILNPSEKESIGFATFYRHYWISKYNRVNEKKLYDAFLTHIKPRNKENYKKFLRDLEKESKVYMKIINPSRTDYQNKKEYYWLVQSLNAFTNYFNVTQVRVLILALFDIKERKLISTKKFKEVIELLENFHFVYNMIMKKPTNKMETIYSNFAIKARSLTSKEEIEKTIESDLKQKLEELLPKYSEFEEAFVALEYSKKENQYNLKSKYVINKLNAYYEGKVLFEDDGTIEHILPESEGEYTKNIGNLILLEGKINNKVDSLDYIDKKSEYKKSRYKWIKDFINENGSFEQKDIKERASNLAKVYYTKILKYEIKNSEELIKN